MSYGPFIEADCTVYTIYLTALSYAVTDVPLLILGADLFAQHILASTPSLIPFCEPSPDVDVPYARMFVGFIGIGPFRSAWTQSRRPEEAKLLMHICNGVRPLAHPTFSSRLLR